MVGRKEALYTNSTPKLRNRLLFGTTVPRLVWAYANGIYKHFDHAVRYTYSSYRLPLIVTMSVLRTTMPSPSQNRTRL